MYEQGGIAYMNMRMNAGYIITDSVHVGRTEFVLGVHSTAPSQFVTWACKGGSDYYLPQSCLEKLMAHPIPATMPGDMTAVG